jgi:hypothetical protein
MIECKSPPVCNKKLQRHDDNGAVNTKGWQSSGWCRWGALTLSTATTQSSSFPKLLHFRLIEGNFPILQRHVQAVPFQLCTKAVTKQAFPILSRHFKPTTVFIGNNNSLMRLITVKLREILYYFAVNCDEGWRS